MYAGLLSDPIAKGRLNQDQFLEELLTICAISVWVECFYPPGKGIYKN